MSPLSTTQKRPGACCHPEGASRAEGSRVPASQILRSAQNDKASRRGSVLVLTLVVVAMLTLGAAAFFERMFAENQAERAHGQQLQASQLAESGVEYMKVLLTRDPEQVQQLGGLYNNSSLFQGVVVND